MLKMGRYGAIAAAVASLILGGTSTAATAEVDSVAESARADDSEVSRGADTGDTLNDDDFIVDENRRLEFEKLVPAELSPGLYFQEEDGAAFIRVFRNIDLSAVEELVARSEEAPFLVRSRYTSAQFVEFQSLVAAIPVTEGLAFGGSYLATSDLFTYSGTVPAETIDRVLSGFEYEYTIEESTGRLIRNPDASPFKGGARTVSTWGECTTGFAVWVSGARRMITAGHCGPLSGNFTTTTGTFMGKMMHKATFPAFDLAMLSNATFTGQVYRLGPAGTPYPVSSSVGDPGLGGNYCVSGSFSYEKCSLSVVSKTAQFCDDSGCTSPVLSFSGASTLLNGDSGAPFYGTGLGNVVPIRGVLFAKSGSTGFAEPWSRVVDRFGASIVTG